MPDWYLLGRAARYWGVPPWELAEQSAAWREWGNLGATVDAYLAEKREAAKTKAMFGNK